MSLFVYVYNDDNGIPFYVGKGTKTRHLYRRNHLVTPPKRKNIQVFTCNTEQEAFEMEMFLIEFFGRKLDEGTLDNLSLGGPGCRGYKAVPEGGYKPRGKYNGSKSNPPASPGILDRPCLNVRDVPM